MTTITILTAVVSASALALVSARSPAPVAPALAQETDTKSKEPPAGAPWTKDFVEARTRAIESGRPIFLYSTKTY